MFHTSTTDRSDFVEMAEDQKEALEVEKLGAESPRKKTADGRLHNNTQWLKKEEIVGKKAEVRQFLVCRLSSGCLHRHLEANAPKDLQQPVECCIHTRYYFHLNITCVIDSLCCKDNILSITYSVADRPF